MKLTVIEGDGIGRGVLSETVKILDVFGL